MGGGQSTEVQQVKSNMVSWKAANNMVDTTGDVEHDKEALKRQVIARYGASDPANTSHYKSLEHNILRPVTIDTGLRTDGMGNWSDAYGHAHTTRTDFTDAEKQAAVGISATGHDTKDTSLSNWIGQVDKNNVSLGAKDWGANTTDAWYGKNIKTAGVYAHTKRMQTNTTRPGDHGELTGTAADVMNVVKRVPLVGTAALGGEAAWMGATGDPDAGNVAMDTVTNAIYDAGFVASGGAAALGEAAAQKIIGSTVAEQVVARSLAGGGLEAADAVVSSGAGGAVNTAENAGVAANKIVSGAAKSAGKVTGTKVAATAAAKSTAEQAGEDLAAQDVAKFNASTVAMKDSEEDVTATVVRSVKQGAKTTAKLAAMGGVGVGIDEALTGGHTFDPEYKDNDLHHPLSQDTIRDLDAQWQAVYGKPSGQTTKPNGEKPKPKTRTSTSAHPGRTTGYNEDEEQQHRLAMAAAAHDLDRGDPGDRLGQGGSGRPPNQSSLDRLLAERLVAVIAGGLVLVAGAASLVR